MSDKITPVPAAIRELIKMRRLRLLLVLSFILLVLLSVHSWPQSLHHKSSIPINNKPLDFPFARGCSESHDEKGERANATFLMLCRESELADVLETLRSVERHFNNRFRYPYVFFNDKPFSVHFKSAVRNEVPNAIFCTVAEEAWGFPAWIDPVQARAAFTELKGQGLKYGDQESYHHMCRFYSGYAVSY